ncbi:AzlD domain-containing protein [Janibacter hoylei]|uniref:AzlD domain-containing protein n=1 Tax=Janibacter hoylei TaxID=364298 RepID=UPI0021A7403C|nr:AzlD domain-containing protein [Janibacter hoylei]MCT1618114.1 AzlD domain-containing protein [Janibacter hoylei]MCT2292265.1 AzlD domain-containing protein [Janibacter hoylei]
MSATSLWVCVLAACVLGFVTKYVGYLVPESLVDGRRRSRIIGLLPVALLAGLLVTQTVGGNDGIVVDARLAAVALAVVLLWLRANFVIVVFAAAALAAGLRALGWG